MSRTITIANDVEKMLEQYRPDVRTLARRDPVIEELADYYGQPVITMKVKSNPAYILRRITA